MVEPGNLELSIGKQCRLLSISRSSFYFKSYGKAALNEVIVRFGPPENMHTEQGF